MEDKLYLIGKFASMNKVSTRMLRHYDKINLLNPISIKENGYRYYSEQQIAIISKIKLLRDCDFSLDEIAQIFKNDSDTFFMEQIKLKMIDLNQQVKLHQKALKLLEGFSKESCQNNFINQYGISLVQREENTLLISKQKFSLEHIETEFDKLFVFLDKTHLNTNGCAVSISYFDENNENKNQVGIPVTEAYQDEQYITIVLPKSKCISTIHYGDYYNIGYAYNSIIRYAELNDYSIENCFTERYLIDSSHTVNQTQYVTEVSVSIKNSL
ncbi:MerR family transcriptional regulator [Clostridioides difficile]